MHNSCLNTWNIVLFYGAFASFQILKGHSIGIAWKMFIQVWNDLRVSK